MNMLMETAGRLVAPLFGTGVGRIPGVVPLYKWAWRLIGPKGIVNTDAQGFKIKVDARDWAVAPSLLWHHTWESEETAIVKQYVRKSHTFVDVGAHVGYYSLIASRLADKVYSFEPSPETYNLLLENLADNKADNVIPRKCAVSDYSGTMILYHDGSPASNSAYVKGTKFIVSCDTLDNLMEGRRVDFIKMDCEGNEVRVLKGAVKTLADNYMSLLTEIFPEGLEKAGTSWEEYVTMLEFFFDKGLYVVDKKGGLRRTTKKLIGEACKQAGSINVFCRKESKC